MCTRAHGVYARCHPYFPNSSLFIAHTVTQLSSKSIPPFSKEHEGTRNIWRFHPLCLHTHTWITHSSPTPKTVLHSKFTIGQRIIHLPGCTSSQPSMTRSPACAHAWITRRKQSLGGPRAFTRHHTDSIPANVRTPQSLLIRQQLLWQVWHKRIRLLRGRTPCVSSERLAHLYSH